MANAIFNVMLCTRLNSIALEARTTWIKTETNENRSKSVWTGVARGGRWIFIQSFMYFELSKSQVVNCSNPVFCTEKGTLIPSQHLFHYF